MGIITDPGYKLYVGENVCFPEGQTPKKLYATLSGIGCGELWTPEYGMPLNGTYILETTEGTTWWTGEGSYTVVAFSLPAPHSELIMHRWDGPRQFEGGDIPCKFAFQNIYQNPETTIFCGGYGSIVMREPGSPVPSIQTTCNLIGVPPDKKTFAELSLDGNGKQIIRLARQKDGTCIRVKY